MLNLPMLLGSFLPTRPENQNTGFFRLFALVLGPGKGRGGSRDRYEENSIARL